jgi:ABC-type transport system involved in cytochrome c biogenesis permease subunit
MKMAINLTEYNLISLAFILSIAFLVLWDWKQKDKVEIRTSEIVVFSYILGVLYYNDFISAFYVAFVVALGVLFIKIKSPRINDILLSK